MLEAKALELLAQNSPTMALILLAAILIKTWMPSRTERDEDREQRRETAMILRELVEKSIIHGSKIEAHEKRLDDHSGQIISMRTLRGEH